MTESNSPSLLKSSTVVSSATMSSRVLGLLRDIVIARIFGSEDAADAFFVAFRIPNFFRRLFSEGAFSQAFVPVLSDYRINNSFVDTQRFVNRVANLLGSIVTLFVLLAVLGATVVTSIFAPGFIDEPDKFELTKQMIRWTFPYLLFISLTGFAGAILNTYDRFAIPALTPIILNVCLISAALLANSNQLVTDQPIVLLAQGVLVAGVLQFIFQLPFLKRINLLPTPTFSLQQWQLIFKDSGVRRLLSLMVPMLFAVSVSQINLLFDTLIASFLISGSVSWLYYSDRLIELPLGVFAIAIATIVLPRLSRQFSSETVSQYNATMDWALRMVLLIGCPATIALILLGEPILSTLFLYGAMTELDISMAAKSLIAYCVGLVGFMLIKILVTGFYSKQNTKTPVRIGIIAMVANMLLNIVFVLPLYFYGGIGHVGLALATAVSAWINAGLLYIKLRQEGGFQHQTKWLQFAMRLLIALVLMTLFLWSMTDYWHYWVQWQAFERSWRLLLLCLGGAAFYIVGLFIAGMRRVDFQS